MMNALLSYLKENIDDNANIIVFDGKSQFPLYLLEIYDLYELEILDETCLLIGFININPSLEEVKKHLKVFQKGFNGPTVIAFQSITSYRRKSLIDNRIPFLVSDGQMYLPFLGLDLKKILKEQLEPIKKFSNSTQLAFLYFLYNKHLSINAKELSFKLNITHMTASRVLNELHSLNLLSYQIGGKNGRTKIYKRISDPHYYQRGREFLKDPISQTIYVEEVNIDCLVAGVEALSIISMINPPKRSVRAISKQKLKSTNFHINKNKDQIADRNLTELQVWNYDPEILNDDNYVDILSLALSLKKVKDERVEQALEERLKGETWYTE